MLLCNRALAIRDYLSAGDGTLFSDSPQKMYILEVVHSIKNERHLGPISIGKTHSVHQCSCIYDTHSTIPQYAGREVITI